MTTLAPAPGLAYDLMVLAWNKGEREVARAMATAILEQVQALRVRLDPKQNMNIVTILRETEGDR